MRPRWRPREYQPRVCMRIVFRGPWCSFMLFFFSSRRRHTRYIGDWSSDVCSSDLTLWKQYAIYHLYVKNYDLFHHNNDDNNDNMSADKHFHIISIGDGYDEYFASNRFYLNLIQNRSEERRVGKECCTMCWSYNYKK